MAQKKIFRDFSSLGSISAKLIFENLPFVLFLGFLATIYIANSHYATHQSREIKDLDREVELLKQRYNSLEADIGFDSRHSEVERKVEELGLRADRKSPRVIRK